jgi:hypothetical protein
VAVGVKVTVNVVLEPVGSEVAPSELTANSVS